MSQGIQDYEEARYGPLLGVSDDGSAAAVIVGAAARTPKAITLKALGQLDKSTLGLVLDGERMTIGGELVIGLPEYEAIGAALRGEDLYFSTNVGTVVPMRYYRRFPIVDATDKATDVVLAEVTAILDPYLDPPGGDPVPVEVYVFFKRTIHADVKAEVLAAVATGTQALHGFDSSRHVLGLYQRSNAEGDGIGFAIELAQRVGLQRVAVDADPTQQARDRLSMPGLTAYFDATTANALVAKARAAGITLTTRFEIDVETAARYVWSSLSTARQHGADLGKFGMIPLSIDQQGQLMRLVSAWLPGWAATPAFYVDQPWVVDGVVVPDPVDAATAWLDHAQRAGIGVALIDCPDRTPAPPGMSTWDADRGRRLLKRDANDEVGVLDRNQLLAIVRLARDRRIRTLWAGGLSRAQAYWLAQQAGVLGIYTTSSTAQRVGIREDGAYPYQPDRSVPTGDGVAAMKLIIEAGFLVAQRRAAGQDAEADRLDALAIDMIDALDGGGDPAAFLEEADDVFVAVRAGWEWLPD